MKKLLFFVVGLSFCSFTSFSQIACCLNGGSHFSTDLNVLPAPPDFHFSEPEWTPDRLMDRDELPLANNFLASGLDRERKRSHPKVVSGITFETYNMQVKDLSKGFSSNLPIKEFPENFPSNMPIVGEKPPLSDQIPLPYNEYSNQEFPFDSGKQ